MTEPLDNTEFLSVVHDLIGTTNECISSLTRGSEAMDDDNKELVLASIRLLQLHIRVLSQLAERNSTMLEHANVLIDHLKGLEKP